jgi:hypothetical protein
MEGHQSIIREEQSNAIRVFHGEMKFKSLITCIKWSAG